MAAHLLQAYVRRRLSRMTGTSAIYPSERSATIRIRALIIAAGLLAFAIKITLTLNTYGTNDVTFWEADVAKVGKDGGHALYRDGISVTRLGNPSNEPFNQAPFMIHVLKMWG